MFTGNNILGTGTSAVEDLGLYMCSLQSIMQKNCNIRYPRHGLTIHDLNAKISKELTFKFRQEKQVISGMQRLRKSGAKRLNIQEIVTSMYGDSVNEVTRTLALEPFINKVLQKLAGDGKVGFDIRTGQKRWYLVPVKQHFSLVNHRKNHLRSAISS